MAESLDRQVGEIAAAGVDAGVDPLLLAIVLGVFLAGAVGPFAACVWGAFRDKHATSGKSEPVAVDNPVEPTVVPAADPFSVAPIEEALTEDPANDDEPSADADYDDKRQAGEAATQ